MIRVKIIEFAGVRQQIIKFPMIQVAIKMYELVSFGTNSVVGPNTMPTVRKLVIVIINAISPRFRPDAFDQGFQR
jgi:hypothetical protein